MDPRSYVLVDMLGTFAFATSGAAAAKQEIYALAALVAAALEVVSEIHEVPPGLTQGGAIGACLLIRFLALRYSWSLPAAGGR